ncbi:UDP-3-O-[3-hydroxymyristoyl] glucosamine N-acyltransferase [Desulforamulus aeronauticus DSM 10349]|uniref:UDP-3-O-[3-hydroxymyristoyl] glucosamine N-acyltransferase n=2 Tax=Desulforamulus aeronauticus TaxID=53343 RepID=A0A1M6V4K9_9FIRM|nr:UDP-3-O-[3-hydroxymyristoyl] glucosamine N-acyltransferase [Desulforamulus aeronauticus DSM 10349]
MIRDLLEVLKKNDIPFEFNGNEEWEVDGFSSIYNYRENSLTWIRDIRMLHSDKCRYGDSIRCIVTAMDAPADTVFEAQIRTPDPGKAFFEIVNKIWGTVKPNAISPAAVIEEGAVIGENVAIGANTFISSQAVIGDNCRIGANVFMTGKITIGHDCVVQSGAALGEDGFAFIIEPDKLTHVKHYGGITIGNHVSIGANCCICRGTIDDTIIGNYVKINALCHIAHNVHIEPRTVVAAGAVIMGSVHIGSDCWISTATIRDHRSVGSHVTVGMGSVVVSNIEDNMTVVGCPAKPLEFKNG